MRLQPSAPALALALGWALAGCGTRPVAQNEGHIVPETRPTASIPQPVRAVPLPPPPEVRESEVRYSVVVANQPVRDVLLAMARETKVNFDIHPGIEGTINLNAIDQTLKQILTRIARQVDMRWESDGQTITVMPDTPYLRTYKVDYVNMARDVSGTIGVQSQVVAPPTAGGAGAASASQNSSLLKVDNSARNRFWETLEKNVKDLLRETDKQLPEGSSETFVQARGRGTTTAASATSTRTTGSRQPSTTGSTTAGPSESSSTQASDFVEQRLTFREMASVIVNPESGIVTVRATSRQHEKVAEFLANVIGSARRQVLIEATVVEVQLNDRYQAGVDWSALGLQGLGYSFQQNLISGTGTLANAANPFFSIQYANPNAATGGSISSTIKLLDTFGNTRVLSSPRIMAINNQTAVLKIVDNLVYFTVDVTPGTVSSGVVSPAVIKTTPQLVPVGFVMNVTPQVSESDVVVLNVRPTVTSKIGEVRDPNPELARVNQSNLVPVIRSREFESVLRIPSGSTAILGGLMEDRFEGTRGGLPLISRVPFLGEAVSYRDDTSSKRELVIFLRPVVVRDASLDGDLSAYRRYLPAGTFFDDTRPAGSREFEKGLRDVERGNWPKGTPVPVVPEPAGGMP